MALGIALKTDSNTNLTDKNDGLGPIDLSIIIPLFNEEENIKALIQALTQFLHSIPLTTEVLLINDGSYDGTKFQIENEIKNLNNFHTYSFRTNLGKSAVYTLGFRKARGQLIATMDGDLQDDPSDLIPMLEQIKAGMDMVIGWKYQGKSGFQKRIYSIFFNYVVRKSTGYLLHDINCPLRVMKRDCARNTRLTGDSFRYIPLILAWRGFKIAEVRVKNLPRLAGHSKYGMRRYGQAFFDLFTLLFLHRYRQKPMHFFGIFGMASFSFGFAINAFLTVRGLLVTGVIGHSALLLLGIFLMMAGLQIVLFGFMASLIEDRQRDDLVGFLE